MFIFAKCPTMSYDVLVMTHCRFIPYSNSRVDLFLSSITLDSCFLLLKIVSLGRV